jgi:hypothetical protein
VQRRDGNFELSHMDEFIDGLLREERVNDIQLPRLVLLYYTLLCSPLFLHSLTNEGIILQFLFVSSLHTIPWSFCF